MKQYQVTGMSCAACAARVEKAVQKVPGVTSCSVSLLTNSMGVEGTAGAEEIIRAVEEAGYGASTGEQAQAKGSARKQAEALEDHETPKLKKRLLSSLVFLLMLMYVSMAIPCGPGRFRRFWKAIMWPWALFRCFWPSLSC